MYNFKCRNYNGVRWHRYIGSLSTLIISDTTYKIHLFLIPVPSYCEPNIILFLLFLWINCSEYVCSLSDDGPKDWHRVYEVAYLYGSVCCLVDFLNTVSILGPSCLRDKGLFWAPSASYCSLATMSILLAGLKQILFTLFSALSIKHDSHYG